MVKIRTGRKSQPTWKQRTGGARDNGCVAVLTGDKNADGSGPRQPRDAAQSLDAAQGKPDKGSNGDEDGGACAMAGKRVERSSDTQDTGTRNENAEEGKCDAEDLVSGASQQFSAYVVEAIHIRVAELEDADDVARP